MLHWVFSAFCGKAASVILTCFHQHCLPSVSLLVFIIFRNQKKALAEIQCCSLKKTKKNKQTSFCMYFQIMTASPRIIHPELWIMLNRASRTLSWNPLEQKCIFHEMHRGLQCLLSTCRAVIMLLFFYHRSTSDNVITQNQHLFISLS